MSCLVKWWDVLFVKGIHFSSKNAHVLNHRGHFNDVFIKYFKDNFHIMNQSALQNVMLWLNHNEPFIVC